MLSLLEIAYWVLRMQADWTFILLLELPAKELRICPEKCCHAPHVLRSLHNERLNDIQKSPEGKF
jgi:hypothetical protein